MDDATEITVVELRAAFDRLLNAAERRFGQRLKLEGDRYWCFHPADAFNLDSQPPIGACELTDDIGTIREMLLRTDPDEDDLLLWHDLHHLAGILQGISKLAGA